MVGKLQHFICGQDTVLHTVEADMQEILIQGLIQCGSFFNHSRQFQDYFFAVNMELVAAVQQTEQNIPGILVGEMLNQLQLSALKDQDLHLVGIEICFQEKGFFFGRKHFITRNHQYYPKDVQYPAEPLYQRNAYRNKNNAQENSG